MTQTQLAEFAKEFPDCVIGIKFACRPRVAVKASEAGQVIANAMKENDYEYARNVFIPCGQYDTLKRTLGLK